MIITGLTLEAALEAAGTLAESLEAAALETSEAVEITISEGGVESLEMTVPKEALISARPDTLAPGGMCCRLEAPKGLMIPFRSFSSALSALEKFRQGELLKDAAELKEAADWMEGTEVGEALNSAADELVEKAQEAETHRKLFDLLHKPERKFEEHMRRVERAERTGRSM